MIDYDFPPPWLFVQRTQAHFDELDAQWILHHSRQIARVERAQQALFDRVMEMRDFDPVAFPDLNVVVRRLEVDYLQPLRGVRPFMITLQVTGLRACGLTTRFELRSNDGSELYTQGLREVCKLTLDTQLPALWTETFRERYGALLWEG
jgi:acyl-CoA thioesterase FadM